jgi:hypothetical protein
MYRAHHVSHSLPVAGLAVLAYQLWRGRWPSWGAAWALHILVDIPTHSRRNWAPQFLWPLSRVTVDGVSWPEALIRRDVRNMPEHVRKMPPDARNYARLA